MIFFSCILVLSLPAMYLIHSWRRIVWTGELDQQFWHLGFIVLIPLKQPSQQGLAGVRKSLLAGLALLHLPQLLPRHVEHHLKVVLRV